MLIILFCTPFQFHKGTIKTDVPRSGRSQQAYFNSIKVQLKPIIVYTSDQGFYNFNSIKVQLKLGCGVLHSGPRKFQFHKGTIKTERKWEYLVDFNNFNSIKVQLKHDAGKDIVRLLVFQFHKGTIKTSAQRTTNPRDSRFQFHKGTIKTNHAWW